jgi:hypothetical protein
MRRSVGYSSIVFTIQGQCCNLLRETFLASPVPTSSNSDAFHGKYFLKVAAGPLKWIVNFQGIGNLILEIDGKIEQQA